MFRNPCSTRLAQPEEWRRVRDNPELFCRMLIDKKPYNRDSGKPIVVFLFVQELQRSPWNCAWRIYSSHRKALVIFIEATLE